MEHKILWLLWNATGNNGVLHQILWLLWNATGNNNTTALQSVLQYTTIPLHYIQFYSTQQYHCFTVSSTVHNNYPALQSVLQYTTITLHYSQFYSTQQVPCITVSSTVRSNNRANVLNETLTTTHPGWRETH